MPAQREEQELQRGERDVDHQLRRIEREFATGFEAVARIGLPAVSIFGSARLRENDRWYLAAMETARAFVRHGFAVVTGGGPGIMEAATAARTAAPRSGSGSCSRASR